MKYSFMSFSCPQLTLGELLATAKRFGYEGVEPRIDSQHKHGVETAASAAQRKETKKQAATDGVAFACIATSCVFANPEITKQNVDYTLKCIDLAADVGAGRIRVFGGNLAKDQKREDAIRIVADALRAVGDHAKGRGVTVCMETHDSWCLPEDVAAVMQRVNHPAIAVNWDIMHPVRVCKVTMDQAFETLKPWIRHLHVHDGTPGSTQLMPIGNGGIDHRRAIELLQTIPYDGYLSGEWINWSDPYEVHLPRELATMKSYERAAAAAR
ncbi:MAG: sugar phosphate isomerase/epimerase [Verrucomicrobia bacterium]|nr:sugar phosphate isomerase/epimerase [Verrucomicrobiota bacterium]